MDSKELARLVLGERGLAKARDLRQRTAHLKHKLLVQSGIRHWGTKSFEFWTLLSVLLVLVRPRSIVELGSGRSTSYLAEYAMKESVPYASIEQNRFYATKIKRGLRNSFLNDSYLHHVPISEDGWYQEEELDRAVDFPCEMLFVDGPVSQDPHVMGARNCERSLRWLVVAAATSKVVIVDDVHARSYLKMFHELVSASDRLSTMYLSYYVGRRLPNVIALAVPCSSYGVLVRVCSEIGIEFFTDYSADQCSQP